MVAPQATEEDEHRIAQIILQHSGEGDRGMPGGSGAKVADQVSLGTVELALEVRILR